LAKALNFLGGKAGQPIYKNLIDLLQ